MRILGTAIAAFVLIAPLPARAYTWEDAKACTPDAWKLCRHVMPDRAKVTECLYSARPFLSPACAVVMGRSGRDPDDPRFTQQRPNESRRY
ncbi:MAG: hypothetical protein JO205_02315 [Pseudolabrys sp.]|nr:hypothetical protein [Pseudolabrys sp.]